MSPTFVILAGSVPTKALVDSKATISSVSGQWFEGIEKSAWTMPVFHPSFLLRNPTKKNEMLVDIHAIREKYMEVFPEDTLNPLTPVFR